MPLCDFRKKGLRWRPLVCLPHRGGQVAIPIHWWECLTTDSNLGGARKSLIGCLRHGTPSHTPPSICIVLQWRCKVAIVFLHEGQIVFLCSFVCKFEQEFWLGWLPRGGGGVFDGPNDVDQVGWPSFVIRGGQCGMIVSPIRRGDHWDMGWSWRWWLPWGWGIRLPLECGLWHLPLGCGLWCLPLGCWRLPLGCGLGHLPLGCRRWRLPLGYWHLPLGCGLWCLPLGCGLWLDHLFDFNMVRRWWESSMLKIFRGVLLGAVEVEWFGRMMEDSWCVTNILRWVMITLT